MEQDTMAAFERLGGILDTLRKECPWDRKQTLESLRYLTVEEVYELSEAILKTTQQQEPPAEAVTDLKKEIGDLFMHLMFYAKIAEERQMFSLEDVLNAIADK